MPPFAIYGPYDCTFMALPWDAADACPLFPTYCNITGENIRIHVDASVLYVAGYFRGRPRTTKKIDIFMVLQEGKDRGKAVLRNDSLYKHVFQKLFD